MNEKKGGEGVTLSAVSNGQMLRINTVPISENGPFLRSYGFAIGDRESDVTLDEVSDDTRSLPPLSLREFLRVFVGKKHRSKTENWSQPAAGHPRFGCKDEAEALRRGSRFFAG